jgi:valyl-tRNA synthetase
MQNLPKTYDSSLYEDEIYKYWEENGFFQPLAYPPRAGQSVESNDSGNTKSYTIVMPPPNVTGILHLGHASMLALEDIMTRYNRMKGHKTLWLPGTDHAAIATQAKVEKILREEGTSRHKIGKEKFLDRVRAFAKESHDTIMNQTKKMGSSCDWSREAYTLDETRSKAVRSVFKMMYDDGLIYRGERIVNWCPDCHSTLSDDEVEHKSQKAKLYFFKYDKDFPITIATTRPETKLGDTAVAVNPKDERYKEYIGKEFKVNFCGVKLNIKIIADWHIDMEFGTGALGVTPAHSQVDWQMAEENKLEIVKVINEDGLIRSGFGAFSGCDVYKTRKMIVKKLETDSLIEKTDEIDNNLSICYRCDTPIEPLPSLQWFMDVNKKIKRRGNKSIKELSVEAVKSGVFGREKINIIPERFEKNYFNWMDNLKDWCISRQILFGHQVPVWYKSPSLSPSGESSSPFLSSSDVAERRSGDPVNNALKQEIYVGVEAPDGDGWIQDTDTLDTWFSSGMWTFSTLANNPDQISIENGTLKIDSDDFRNFHPTQVLETGYDILFFWVARMILMTTYAIGDIPFQDVYLHGLVLDEKGKKMSKSKGNSIDPMTMIPKYGTDAVRLALVIGATPGNDLKMSEEKIAGFRNFINKLWNVSRYIIQTCEEGGSSSLSSRTSEAQIRDLVSKNKLKFTSAEKWIIEKMNDLIKSVRSDIENYRFSQAGEDMREFTKDYLADWYLEASKFEESENKEIVLTYVLQNLLKLWHPYIPFITETIWKNFNDSDLIIESYPEFNTSVIASGARQSHEFELTKKIITSIRNARAENKVEPAKKVQAIISCANSRKIIESQIDLIKGMRTGIDEISFVDDLKEDGDAIKVVVGDIEIHLLGAIDKEKEAERIKKEIENLKKMIKITEGKLNNTQFVERAPKEVVEQEKQNLESFKEKLNSLK